MNGHTQLGLSAQAISGNGNHHPHDPSDLRRCIDYCVVGRISTTDLHKRMSGRSIYWDRLLPEWDRLVALLQHEMATRTTDYMAPATYIEMRRVINAGISCEPCGGTGRGDACTKCKGTGRRTGGRCRAVRCYYGASICDTCNGQGFLTAMRLLNAVMEFPA